MNESVVPVSIVSGFILLLLSSKRIRARMAALIAWLVDSITGSRREEVQSEENSQSAETSKGKSKTEVKQNKNKFRQRTRKASEEPTFNTKLSTPIENIIEETLSEERIDTQQSSSQADSQTQTTGKSTGKSKKKKKSLKNEKSPNKSDEEEDVGFSFFKPTSPQPEPSKNKQNLEHPIETAISPESSVIDNVGFSFFPVKDKKQKGGKGKSLLEKHNSGEALTAVISQGIAKKSDPSKPSIIDHYKSKDSPPKKTNNIPQIAENFQNFVYLNKVETNGTKTDLKESKKVTSHISYANVVTNNIPENFNLEKESSEKVNAKETTEVEGKLSKEVSSSIEVLSECSEDPDANTEIAEEVLEIASNCDQLSRTDNTTHIKQSIYQESSDKNEQSEQISLKNESVLEGSIEVIEKSVAEKQKSKDYKSHFEKNILSSVITTTNQSEENFTFVTDHFEHTQSKKVQDFEQEREKEVVKSEKTVNEIVVSVNEESSDQALNDIIEQLVLNENSNIVEDKIAQDILNIETLLIEESRDYLEEKLSSLEKSQNFTEESKNIEKNSQSSSNYNEPLEPSQEEESVHQNIKEAEADVVNVNSEQISLDTKKEETDPHNKYIEESEGFINIEESTVESQLQEDSLSSSYDKFISEVVEDFIKAEIQEEINSEPNLYVASEQIYPLQESDSKPIEEKPFFKELVYIETENQPENNSTDIVFQNLSTEELSNINEIKVNILNTEENSTRTVEQPLAEISISNTDSIQTSQKNQIENQNQNSSEDLIDSNQASEGIIIDNTEDSLIEKSQVEEQHQIKQNNYQSQTEILKEKVDSQFTESEEIHKDLEASIGEYSVELQIEQNSEGDILEEKVIDSQFTDSEVIQKDFETHIEEHSVEPQIFKQNVDQSQREILEEKVIDSQFTDREEIQKDFEARIEEHSVEFPILEQTSNQSQLEEKVIDSQFTDSEEIQKEFEAHIEEHAVEPEILEQNTDQNQREIFEEKVIDSKFTDSEEIQEDFEAPIEKRSLELQILEKNSDQSQLEEKVINSQFTDSEAIQKDFETSIENIQVYTSKQEVGLEPYQTVTDSVLEESPITTMTQIRVLTLNDKEHQESTIYRIEKNFVLQFRLGPSLFGRKIKLYCNYPKETNGVLKEFDRGTYQLLSWCQDEGCKNADDTASFAQIIAKISGSFHYYFIYENGDTEERQGSGYFLVDPILKYGNDEDLPLDCIQCQTVLAKQLGPLSTWENKLKVAKESGYNVIHFTPIQELGISKSGYSLSEQLKLNPMFNEENGKKPTFEDVEKLTNKMRKEWKVLSICDIVLNHTANESEWIKEHTEATYNCVNCPYMRPAYLLDAALHLFSLDVKKGYYEDRGILSEVSTEEHLNAIRYHFKTNVLEPLKLEELFIVDVNKCLEDFLSLARKTPPISENLRDTLGELIVIQDPEFRRLQGSIDLDLALKIYNVYRLDCFDEESRVKRCAEDLKKKLDSLNEVIIKEVSDDLSAAVENVIAAIRYFRVQPDGPLIKEITKSNPLVCRYFTDYGSPKSLKEYEEIMYSEQGQFLMAHNGWVMNSDPLKNFAAAGTKIYIRRELIAWGDSVKLRYGDKPDDSPYLWDYMRKYVEQTAKIFDGVRLDNCHSTPIPVAEYLLDAARKVRSDLYVVAELFTNSDLTDNIFVNRLGITSLIREAMSAWDSHEQGRLVYRYGGVPVGSFFQPSVRPLVPMVAHALFLDLTHDNPSPVEKRSVFDLLPSTALVNMACCASGSSRGYDELVPHHIHVVDETRHYTEWSEDESLFVGNVKFVNDKFGIIAAKKALNELHFKLGKEGYNQVYVDQMDPDIVAVTRHNPETHTSYVLVAFTAFGHPEIHAGTYQRGIKPLRVEGVLDEIVLEASLSHIEMMSGGSRFTKFGAFTKDSTWINGLSEYQVSLKQHIQVNQSDIFEEVNSGTEHVFQLNFKDFKAGSIAVVRVSLPEDMKESVSKVRSLISSFSPKKDTDLRQIISRMTLADLNRALYRCDQEERDEGNGFDVYNIPNYGSTVYCGLQGFMSLLANIRPSNDLGHPFCANLRDGNWAIEYIWKRLKVDEGTKELGQWIEENTKCLHGIPRYLVPSYFDIIVTGIYINLLEQSYSLMSDLVKNGSTFVRSLSLGSLQFTGYVKSADLPGLSPNLAPPKPPTRKNKNGETVQACVTLSAGLPHFSVGYMRNWGRDTFIALRGLLILTGRFEEARQHILGYAACLRHGLIPNLLDGGRNSRFNCRDALWWWLYCIKSYCEEASNGTAILSDKVSRIFPTDESPPQTPGTVDQPLHDVIQEALKIHFQGLKFRERNAGRQIDEQMTDAGFNNQIGIHPETGFVFGGNQWNCGTWMDKMGSSDKAGNKGKPATPRDGSAVELVGLSKAAVSWLWKLNQEGKYPYDGVERTHKNGAITKWTFKDWAEKIQENFEKKFWIGSKPSSEESRPDLINKKSIYKDSFGASQPWTDFQLRPNFPIAMVAAPEIFDPQHAWAALEQAEKYLLGPLGMRTLDPEDWNYRGDYDNSNDSNDFNTSHGFNYHQGPEWVWPIGFFLRAKLIFAAQNGMLKETLASTKVILSKHFTELQTSPWRGLPELTNSNGSYCRDSSRTQAWSMSCILEVLHDLQQIESKQIIIN